MDIKKLIGRGESQSLEFKESLRLKDEIGETVSALSNSDGGVVLVGVSDGGEPIGVDIGGNTTIGIGELYKEKVTTQVHKTVSCDFAISTLLDPEHIMSQTGNLTAEYAEGRGGRING